MAMKHVGNEVLKIHDFKLVERPRKKIKFLDGSIGVIPLGRINDKFATKKRITIGHETFSELRDINEANSVRVLTVERAEDRTDTSLSFETINYFYGLEYRYLNNLSVNFEDIDTTTYWDFTSMYEGCINATKVSTIDFSQALDSTLYNLATHNMFKGCDTLPEVTFINVPPGTTEELLREKTNLGENTKINIEYGVQGKYKDNKEISEINEDTYNSVNFYEMFANSSIKKATIDLSKSSDKYLSNINLNGIVRECNNSIEINFINVYKDVTEEVLREKGEIPENVIINIYYGMQERFSSSSEKIFEEIDTSNTTNFYRAYHNCVNAEIISNIDLSKAKDSSLSNINMKDMLFHAKKLNYLCIMNAPIGTTKETIIDKTSVPNTCTIYIQTKLNGVYKDKIDIEFEEIDTSMSSDFTSMYEGCINATKVSTIDLSKSNSSSLDDIKLNNMLKDCNSLEEVSFVNVPFGTSKELIKEKINSPNDNIDVIIKHGVQGKYKNSKKEIFEEVDTSKNINLSSMYEDCFNATKVSTIDLAMAKDKYLSNINLKNMVKNCNNLKEIVFINVPIDTTEEMIRQKGNIDDFIEIKINRRIISLSVTRDEELDVSYTRLKENDLIFELKELYKDSEKEIFEEVDTSKHYIFDSMYENCSNAVKVSTIDLSMSNSFKLNDISLKNMLKGCNSLNKIKFINVPFGVTADLIKTKTNAPESLNFVIEYGIQRKYKNNTSISFVEENTYKCTNFYEAFENSSAESIKLDLSMSKDKDLTNLVLTDMVKNCNNLKEIKFINVYHEVTEDIIREKAGISSNIKVIIEYGLQKRYMNDNSQIKLNVDTSNTYNFYRSFYKSANIDELPTINLINSNYDNLDNLNLKDMLYGVTKLKYLVITNVPFAISNEILIEKMSISNSCENLHIYHKFKNAFSFKEDIEFEEVDTSKCSDFTSMYKECYNATKVSTIDLSMSNSSLLDDVKLDNMLKDCNALNEITFVNVPPGTTEELLREKTNASDSIKFIIKYGVQGKYKDNTSNSFENEDTSKVYNFTSMYEGCINATKVSWIDLRNALDIWLSNIELNNIVYNCNSLNEITFVNVPLGVTEETIRKKGNIDNNIEIKINYQEIAMKTTRDENTESSYVFFTKEEKNEDAIL